MANEPRDGWDIFDIITKAVGTLLLPIFILIASDWYTTQQKNSDQARLAQQKEADDAQRNTDRVTLLLTHLASNNPRERLLSVRFIEYLTQTKQFPTELLPVVLNRVNDENDDVANTASHVLTQAVTVNPELAKSVEKAAEASSETKNTVIRAAEKSPGLRQAIDITRIQRATTP